MNKHRLPVNKCPACGYAMDCATVINGDPKGSPKPGCPTLCVNCGEFLKFDQGLRLVKLEWAEMALLDLRAQTVLKQARRLIIERGAIW